MPQKQAQLRKIYDNFGERLKFIREKRGLTLGELSGGKPSTAKSWQDGSRPASEHWEIIATRVGLSVSFVFLGQPKTREDFDFLAKYADEIATPSEAFVVREEAQAPYGSTDTAGKIRSHVELLITLAAGDPHRLGWLLEQLRSHVRPPEHWESDAGEDIHAKIIREESAAQRRHDKLTRHDQSNPPKAQGGAGR